MIVLGIDTATSATAVALRLPDGSVVEARDDPPAGAHPGHATRLLGMAAELLDRHALAAPDLNRIAVGSGPGAFTGLRVGIATARGLAQSLSVELVPVPSLTALARTAPSSAPVLAVIDARRGEVFAAAFAADGGPELVPPVVLAPAGIGSLLEEPGLASVDGARVLGVGDGALRYRAELAAVGIEVPPDDAPEHLLRASAICELGLAAEPAPDYQLVVPDYLRRPDAELTLEAAGATAAGAGGAR
ncbi:MAG TPA: tRNA (adenosine(37)-N6)-threonylcarbamoyltransferase complex dimerization subunit type 1 TsaB [Solirubrobacteraceae bacterium]